MRLTYLKVFPVFLQFYFLTCGLHTSEAQKQTNLLELIRAPIDFLRNIASVILSPSIEPQPQTEPLQFTAANVELTIRTNNVTLIEGNEIFGSAFESLIQQTSDRPKRSGSLGNAVTQNIADLIKLLFPDLSVLKPLEHALRRSEESARSFALCQACKIGLSAVVDYIRSSRNPNNLLDLAHMACPVLPISAGYCHGAIREYGEVLIHIIKIRPHLTPDRMCGMYMQFYGCGTSDPHIYWDVLAEMGYSQKKQGREISSTRKRSSNVEGEATLKILQLTDIHMDPLYRPGSRAQCGKEVCCRGDLVLEKDKEFEAGYFGDYRSCDLPLHTVQNALAHIAETHPDISVIYMTGDLVPHTGIAWKSTKEETQDVITTCSELIRKYFPNTPVIPVIGNHDNHPMNLFAPSSVKDEFSTRWIYEVIAKAWAQWLSPEHLETFLNGGYYSKIVKAQLRIIVLNNNMCMSTNFWQAVEDRDPNGQLHWLVKQLQEAEDLNQNVHILGHIPPNFEMCWNVWGDNYYKIIARFRNTVKAQFFAHNHNDNFGLYYDPIDRDVPISSYFVGASLTPYVNLNPGYKIYIVDGDRGLNSTYDILDHETWIFNLTEANLTPDKAPKWFRLYKAKEIYELENLSPSQLHSFVMRMSNNATYFKAFYRNYYKGVVNSKSQNCDSMCRKSALCNIVSPTFRDYGHCMLLENTDRGGVLPRLIFSKQRGNARTYLGVSGPPFSEPWKGLSVIGPYASSFAVNDFDSRG